MCTVTIIPIADSSGGGAAVRLAINRDEVRRRPSAHPPRVHSSGGRRSIWPVDPVGGGTWVGVNQAGLVAALLNRYDGSAPPALPRRRSRGEIIPLLLEQPDLDRATRLLTTLDPAEFLPFTLVATDGQTLLRGVLATGLIEIQRAPLGHRPVMFTSSGLGDALVEPPRRTLFDTWFGADPGQWTQQQDSFHRHSWPHAGHLSVCMSRDDACTVSLTVVEIAHAAARLSYWGHPPGEEGDPIVQTLPLLGAGR